MRKTLAILAFLVCAAAARGQAITVQPTNETVTVGSSATFSVTVSGGPCSPFWTVNGVGHYGSKGSTVTYVIPLATIAESGTTLSVNLYGCTGGTASLQSNTVTLTVIPVPPTVSLTVTGQLVFDDSTAVYSGPVTISQWNGVTWVSAGSVASDTLGNLTGALSINTGLVDANGYVELEFILPGTSAPIAQFSNTMAVDQFTQGSTGLTIQVVLFKGPMLAKLLAVTKSSSFALTP
jgi:hypothetical protein